ncbi:hypothetical protein, partial [Pseudomonas fragi]
MPDFLDTVEGPDWLHDATNSLICGDNVTAPRPFGKSVALVTPLSLYEALAEHLGAQEQIAPLLTDNREYPIEQVICEIVAGGRRVHGKAYELACCALGAPKAKLRIPRHSDTQPTLIRTPVPRSFGQAVGAQRRRGGIVSLRCPA